MTTDDAQNTKKLHGKPFEKGDKRINRGGRPKGYNAFRKSFRSKEKTDAQREMLEDLALNAPEPKDRLNAIKLMWEYGWGKSPAAPEDNDALRESGRPLENTSAEDIMAALRGKP